MISAAQCRAARAMLDWTQDALAKNAQVARPTIADFERNVRTPMRHNLLSIMATFEAAGLSFIAENGEGAGVRFREVKIQYRNSAKDRGGDIALPIKYREKWLTLIAPLEVINDMDHASYATPAERALSFSNHLPKYLNAAEKKIANLDLSNLDTVTLTHSDFPDGVFWHTISSRDPYNQ